LRFTENQADLQNPCVSQKIKNQAIYRILALYKKSGGFKKSLRVTKDQADLQNPCAGLEKLAARLLFRLSGISSC
jgi:hypothetical protein